jgi:hypothetical protein
MQRRRRLKQITSLEERLAEWAETARQLAKKLPPGPERNDLLRKARQAETGSHLTEWIRSPGFSHRNSK